MSEQSSHGPRASNQVSCKCKSSYKSIYSLEIEIRLSCALFGSSQGHGRSGGRGKKTMGGGVVVQVQLSCGGSYFVNYQMGSIFLNVLVCVKGKKKVF